ncbi:hypothetical protein MES4922_230161 [Mesorhizobium ventifaucium]|uniref:Uncharacterized protein n=1 Tax=Mesorhizobium ventifaucium TaxID=666020 RepID=A0ABN8JR53_9HYPH|nr:hypothetical protein MES4922_230161 [Mesorhizobium ventifaucium]
MALASRGRAEIGQVAGGGQPKDGPTRMIRPPAKDPIRDTRRDSPDKLECISAWAAEAQAFSMGGNHETHSQNDICGFCRHAGAWRRRTRLCGGSHCHHHALARQPILQGRSRRRGRQGQGTRLRNAGAGP